MNDFILAMAKHLPPSASTMQVLDVDGVSAEIFSSLRDDLYFQTEVTESDSVDAVVAYDHALDRDFLSQMLDVLRVGGRLIIVHSEGDPSGELVDTLESAGYVRILVERATDAVGVLIRGEKPHTTANTIARIQTVSTQDANSVDWSDFRGRYVHLLIRQMPNKPVWKLSPDETIEWQAVTIQHHETTVLLGYSSLPKCVEFMQSAVIAGWVQDVNKVGKFKKQVIQDLAMAILFNPSLEEVSAQRATWFPIDPNLAEAPDE